MSAAPVEKFNNDKIPSSGINFPQENIPTSDIRYNKNEAIKESRPKQDITPLPTTDYSGTRERQTGLSTPPDYSDNQPETTPTGTDNNINQQWSNSLAYKKQKAREMAERVKQETVETQKTIAKKGLIRVVIRFLFFTPMGWALLTLIGALISAISMIVMIISTCTSNPIIEEFCKFIISE